MSERVEDWELEFADFDWATQKGKRDPRHISEDEGLAELFSSLDNIRASDALIESTIQKACHQNAVSGSPRSVFRVRPMRQGLRASVGPAHRARLVALAACLLVLLLGMASWFAPVSTMRVTQGDMTVDLGVNVYGIAVSSRANGSVGEQVIARTDVRNCHYEDALEQVLASYDKLREGETKESPSVEISSPGGWRSEDMRHSAEQVIDRYDAGVVEEGGAEGSLSPRDEALNPSEPGSDAQELDEGHAVVPQETSEFAPEGPGVSDAQPEELSGPWSAERGAEDDGAPMSDGYGQGGMRGQTDEGAPLAVPSGQGLEDPGQGQGDGPGGPR